MTPEQIEQTLTEAGWTLDGGGFFSEYRIVGHDEHVSILAHSWVWQEDRHVFKLSDERTGRVYWVHAIPTPWQAKLLLEEHDDDALEEEEEEEEDVVDNPYEELGQYGYAS